MAAGSWIAANHARLSELHVKQRVASSGASLRMHTSQRSPTRILRREVQSLMGEGQEEPGSGWEPARASCRDWGAPTAMARRCSQPSLPWSSSQQGKGVTWHQLPRFAQGCHVAVYSLPPRRSGSLGVGTLADLPNWEHPVVETLPPAAEDFPRGHPAAVPPTLYLGSYTSVGSDSRQGL